MKKNQITIFLFTLMAWFSAAMAQTNPTAVSLPFSLTSQSTSTLPAGVAVHKFSSIQTTRTLSPATGDLPNEGSSPALATGGWYNLGTDGIGLLASTTNPAGAVIVAINTTGLTGIQVSWVCKTIKNQSSRDNSVALQYRVGTTGNFIDVGTTSTYTSAGKTAVDVSPTYTETLPVGAENQSVVQVRWVYWESVSTSGSRDKISVDDISISGSTSTSCNTPTGLASSSITTTTADISWNTVSGASSYEYAVTTSATAPSSGTNTTSTTASVTSLTPNTLYHAYVRTNCGSGVFSSWASSTFTTNDTTSGGGDTSGFVIMTYNLLNYPGTTGSSREPNYRTIMDDVNPDIVVTQEILQSTGANNFLSNVLNYSASNYNLATFIDGYDTDNALYYKTSKFQFISNTPIATDLRDINEFRLKHIASGETLIIYSAHLKASNTSSDEAQRALEVDSLRKVTDTLAAGRYFLVCGDFNIYGDGESAYQKLVTNGSSVTGKFYDQLSMTGTWNNSAYAINHTQSPRTTAFGGGATGGLDDRFDMLLFSDAITQSGGFDIVAGTYKAYGNDGQHYNQALNTPPYTMYSSTIASALHDASDHLPVIVTLKYNSGTPMLASTSNAAGVHKLNAANASNSSSTVTQNTFADVLVYPNPASDNLFVKVNTTVNSPVTLNLFDITGKMVKAFTINNTNKGETNIINLATLNLTKGIYVLQSQHLSSPIKVVIE